MRLPTPPITLAVVATAIVVSVAVTSGETSSPAADATTVAGTVQQISVAELVCPVARSTKNVAQSTLAAAAPSTTASGRPSSGTISVYPLSAVPTASAPLAEAPIGSSVVRYPVPAVKGGPLVVRATGDYARGLTAAVLTRTPSGPGRSLQTEQCSATSGEAWFVGGGATIGRRAVLYLTNVEAAPATVDVTVYTPGGAQLPAPVQGRTINPGQQYAIGIDALVPGAAATAIHVKTRSGRVAAAVSDSQVNGLLAQGADWVPQTTGPARSVVLTGIPADVGAVRMLSLLVPGLDDAVVNLHLVTSAGTLSPDPLQGLSVPAGKVFSLDLDQVPISGPFTVVVESDRSVVAGVRTVRPGGGAKKFPEFSYSAGESPMLGAAALPAAQQTADTGTVLQLTAAGSTDVVVDLTTLVFSGVPPTPRRVTVPAGRTLQVQVGRPGIALSAVLVETAPGAGPLYVGWVVSEAGVHGPLVTGGPLPQTPDTLVLPPVEPDPAVGYPGH